MFASNIQVFCKKIKLKTLLNSRHVATLITVGISMKNRGGEVAPKSQKIFSLGVTKSSTKLKWTYIRANRTARLDGFYTDRLMISHLSKIHGRPIQGPTDRLFGVPCLFFRVRLSVSQSFTDGIIRVLRRDISKFPDRSFSK